jgi:hypothetical protein
MHINREGVTKLNDVLSIRQKTEILDVFAAGGELCYSMLLKKAKDANKAFANNSSMMSLLYDLVDSGELVETRQGTCPYTGKTSQFWATKEKAIERVESLSESAKNIIAYMKTNHFNVLSISDLEKII